jgi:predicted RNA-binding Zn-ribbon protein involved in translation (DUF1610 family)
VFGYPGRQTPPSYTSTIFSGQTALIARLSDLLDSQMGARVEIETNFFALYQNLGLSKYFMQQEPVYYSTVIDILKRMLQMTSVSDKKDGGQTNNERNGEQTTLLYKCPGCGEVYIRESQHECSNCGEQTVPVE